MKICPTCRQPISKGPKRVCANCGRAIGRRHKWGFGPDSRPVHRDCANPEGGGTVAKEEMQGKLLEDGR